MPRSGRPSTAKAENSSSSKPASGWCSRFIPSACPATSLLCHKAANSALLQVAGIKDPASQKLALVAINGIATVLNTILGLVESISTKAQITAMAAQVRVTLAQVRPLMDQGALQASADRVSHDLQLPQPVTVDQFFAYEAQAGF